MVGPPLAALRTNLGAGASALLRSIRQELAAFTSRGEFIRLSGETSATPALASMGRRRLIRMASRVRPGNLSAVVAIGIVLLGGCSLILPKTPPATAPTARITEGHFDRALELLQRGKADEADVELHSYLEAVPGSKSASFLIQQIEAPVATLFPPQNFRVQIPRGGSLSSFAKTYLGNSLAFYGLARYNKIAVPMDVREGQWLRIPKTASSLAARRAAVAVQSLGHGFADPEPPLLLGCLAGRDCSQAVPLPPAPGANETVPDGMLARPSSGEENKSTAPDEQPASRAVAERHYRDGQLAFQKQDLDGAIAAWHKALAADPGFIDAQLRLFQAEQLRQKLDKLRK